MTEILESVDWDEEKQKELVEYVQQSVNNDSTSFLDTIETKYGILAKNVIKNIIKYSCIFKMKSSRTGKKIKKTKNKILTLNLYFLLSK